jgi:hypothetical protein
MGSVIGAFTINLARGNGGSFNNGVAFCPPFTSKTFRLFCVFFGVFGFVGVDVIGDGVGDDDFVNHGASFLSFGVITL